MLEAIKNFLLMALLYTELACLILAVIFLIVAALYLKHQDEQATVRNDPHPRVTGDNNIVITNSNVVINEGDK